MAKFLNFLKGPSVDYLISLFFELTHMYVKQKQRRLSGALTWELGPISGELWKMTHQENFFFCLAKNKDLLKS